MLWSKLLFVVFLVSLWVPFHAFAGEVDLKVLVAEALQGNPELSAARERWQQSGYQVEQVGSYDDPVFSFSLSSYPYDTLKRDVYSMTGDELRLAQKFPFPEKLNTKAGMAEQQAAWFKQVYLDNRLQLVRRVKDAWYRLYARHKAVEVTERNIALLDDMIRLTEVRYATGEGLQQDVLKAQLRRSSLLERLIGLQQQVSTLQAELNSLSGGDARRLIEPPGLLPELDFDLPLVVLEQQARQQRPMIRAYHELAERSRGQQRLAKLDDYPDLTLWASWRFRDGALADGGTDFVSTGISFNLPVQRDRRRAALAEAEATERMVRSQLENFQRQQTFNLHEAYNRLEESRQQVVLYSGGIIPQATQNFNAALSAYRVGKLELISLLDALRSLYDYELAYYQAQSEGWRAVARIEAETAVGLEEEDGRRELDRNGQKNQHMKPMKEDKR